MATNCVSAAEQDPSTSKQKTSGTLPITPDREKMSRALGAAFLQHKVQQLERNLDDLSFRRDLHHPSRGHSKKKTHPVAYPTSSPSTSPPPIKVIDTSMLIHALPILKKWVRQAKSTIVIPLDVVSELDFLKTSPPPIHGLVREATCWLDKQFQNSTHTSSTTSPDKPCFIPQRTGNESGWQELSERFVPPPLEVASIPFIKDPVEDAEQENPREGDLQEPAIDYRPLISTDLPHHHRSLLQCALYYQLHACPEQECELVIFFSDNESPSSTNAPKKPFDHQHLQTSKASSHWNSQNKSFPENNQEEEPVDKTLDLFNWAQRFEIKIQKIHPGDLAQAKQWIRNHNDKLKQQHHQHHYSQRPGPASVASPASSATSTPNRILHSNTNRAHPSPRQPPSSTPRSSAPSSASASDKRLFLW